MIIYHDTTSLAEMLQSASVDHDGEFNPGSWAEYLDEHQDGRTAPAPLRERRELAARRQWAQNTPAPMTHDEARAAVELSNALDGQIGFTP